MNHQEWFERFQIRIRADLDEFCGSAQLVEEWKSHQSALIRMAIETLPSFNRRIVKLIFYNGLTEREAAKQLKITRSRLHRIKVKTLRQLAEQGILNLVRCLQLKY